MRARVPVVDINGKGVVRSLSESNERDHVSLAVFSPIFDRVINGGCSLSHKAIGPAGDNCSSRRGYFPRLIRR